ncbi:MAG: PD-(D/E)XK nuclease family protein [Candidatus Aenigmatarchaeota archaeon]
MFKLSPSSLSTLKDCPLCFWLAFNKNIEMPGGIFPSLPSGMDSVLKKHFDSFRERGDVPPELKGTDAKLFNNMDLLKVWRSNFKGIRWEDNKGNVLHGAVDEILEKDGKLIVLDFKTRGFPCKDDTHEHYRDQMDIYNFLLRKNGYDTEDYAYLLFFHPIRIEADGHFEFERTLKKIEINVNNAEKIFKAAIKCLEGPEPESGKNCGVCEFVGERGKIWNLILN